MRGVVALSSLSSQVVLMDSGLLGSKLLGLNRIMAGTLLVVEGRRKYVLPEIKAWLFCCASPEHFAQMHILAGSSRPE